MAKRGRPAKFKAHPLFVTKNGEPMSPPFLCLWECIDWGIKNGVFESFEEKDGVPARFIFTKNGGYSIANLAA